jgi:hypothetical protein
MIDDTDCTKTIGNKARIGFLQGEPKAIMMFATSDAMEDTERQADALIKDRTITLATHCLKFTVLILTK